MAEIWVTSDTHFGHANIIKYCDRPFTDVWEMNSVMMKNWNAVVASKDHVWHLGDFYFPGGFQHEDEKKSSAAWDFLRCLNGKKRLVLGNHDNGKNQLLQKLFDKIVLWRDDKKLGLLFTHVPVHPDSIIDGRRNVHGHTHQRSLNDKRYVNACVEHHNYTPIHIEEL